MFKCKYGLDSDPHWIRLYTTIPSVIGSDKHGFYIVDCYYNPEYDQFSNEVE